MRRKINLCHLKTPRCNYFFAAWQVFMRGFCTHSSLYTAYLQQYISAFVIEDKKLPANKNVIAQNQIYKFSGTSEPSGKSIRPIRQKNQIPLAKTSQLSDKRTALFSKTQSLFFMNEQAIIQKHIALFSTLRLFFKGLCLAGGVAFRLIVCFIN